MTVIGADDVPVGIVTAVDDDRISLKPSDMRQHQTVGIISRRPGGHSGGRRGSAFGNGGKCRAHP